MFGANNIKKKKLDKDGIINLSEGRVIKMNETEINVEGMHCTGCENRIKNVLESIDGIEKVEANHETGKVKITSKREINIEEIKNKIEDLDFKVKN